MDDAVPQRAPYRVCGHKKRRDQLFGFRGQKGQLRLKFVVEFKLSIAQMWLPSDSNHIMMSNMRCKHGLVVRIPPSVDRVDYLCSRLNYVGLCKYTLWHSHNDDIAWTTRFSEHIPVINWHTTVICQHRPQLFETLRGLLYVYIPTKLHLNLLN